MKEKQEKEPGHPDYRPCREHTRMLGAHIKEDRHRKFKRLADVLGKSTQQLIAEYVEDMLDQHRDKLASPRRSTPLSPRR